MSEIKKYADWDRGVDAFGQSYAPGAPVSYSGSDPGGFADDPKQLYQPSAAEDIAYELGQLDQWQADPGGVEFRLGQVVQSASVLHDLDGSERYGLVAGFEGLPWDARDAIFDELSLGDADANKLPTEFESEWFSATITMEADLLLRSHWGAFYDRNVQKVARRTRRIFKNIPTRDRARVDDWFDGLSDRQAVAACIALAS